LHFSCFTHNFYIKTILLRNNIYGKKLSASVSIYLLVYRPTVIFLGGIAKTGVGL